MWQIIRNEWQSWMRNRTLLGISIGFVAILCLTIYLGYLQTEAQSERYQSARQHLRHQWENNREMHPHGAVHYGTYVFKPINLLSSLDEGVSSITGNVLRIEGHVQNEIIYSEASQMQANSKFGKLKSSLLLQYIIPLLLIFLAYQSINSEKQSGRLKLLLLQGANPIQLVLAKTFAVTSYGMGLLALTILSYALFHLSQISAEIWGRTILFFCSYSLYYFIIAGFTVFLSFRLKNTSLALTSMLGLWIIWTIFSPHILMSSVEQWHQLPTREAFKKAMKEDRAKGIDGHNPRDERRKELEEQILAKYEVDSLSELPIDFGGILMQADEEYGNEVWDKHFGYIREVLGEQKQSYQLGGILNPFISLQNLSMGLAGNDNWHHQAFLVQAETYRRNLIKTLNDEHAYGTIKEGDDYIKVGPEFFQSIEPFRYQPVPFSATFPIYGLNLTLLIMWSLLAGLLLILGTKNTQIL
ncbi:MAG: DUF3526 domain-containing protein [Bacteroidota bacterium]